MHLYSLLSGTLGTHAVVSNTNTLDDLRPPPEQNISQCQRYTYIKNNKEHNIMYI